MNNLRSILVIGIMLADKVNLAESIAHELSQSQKWSVEQKWVSIGKTIAKSSQMDIVEHLENGEPKFVILNRILSETNLEKYDYIIITDDDIVLPVCFLETYLAMVEQHDFALSQPARTHDSYIDHRFVEQLDGINARQTMFVEIGPLFCIRADAIGVLIPFDVTTPMGWGYDFTWPLTMEAAGLKMGIVDIAPVSHKLRKPVSNYSHGDADRQMKAYLSSHPHLQMEDAFRIIESFC
ncbi:MAG: hypothetical protein ACKN9T_19385 [Candidatus Methylumidiphilus sp.]